MSTLRRKCQTPSQSPKNDKLKNVGCCICGKRTIQTTRQPFPKNWPMHLRVYATDIAHKTCIQMTRKVKTEYSAGLIHKRWEMTPGLGKKYDTKGKKVKTNKHVNIIKPEQNYGRKPFTPNTKYKEDGSYVVSARSP